MAGVPIMISVASASPPPTRGSSARLTTASNDSASWARICSCRSSGKTSMIRWIVFAHELVCKVASVKCPVSARDSTVWIVSTSRISPTSTTSGLWRKTLRSARANDGVSRPTSLVVERAAESGEPRYLEREVTVLLLLQLGDSPLAQECVREPNNRVGPGRRQLFHRGQFRGHAQAWRPIHRQKNVGRAAPQR